MNSHNTRPHERREDEMKTYTTINKPYRSIFNGVKLCDGDCNQCPLMRHPNSRMVTAILNTLLERFGDGVYEVVEGHCPNLTVCYDCRVDDFCHAEGCDLASHAETAARAAGGEHGTGS